LCPYHLCEVFWQERLLEVIRAKSGAGVATFRPFTDYNGNIIVETQELSWIEAGTNEERSRLHRYKTNEGSIGGSGYPDPKRIKLADGRSFALTRTSIGQACEVCGRVGHDWPKDLPPLRPA
jgi:hypothetical protein